VKWDNWLAFCRASTPAVRVHWQWSPRSCTAALRSVTQHTSLQSHHHDDDDDNNNNNNEKTLRGDANTGAGDEMVTTFTYKPSLVRINACNFQLSS